MKRRFPDRAAGFSGNGFDISSHNGVVDWNLIADADMDFVMIRTGLGQAPDVDAQFEANYNGAVAAGLKVGVYHCAAPGRRKMRSKKLSFVWRFLMEES